MNKKNIGAGLFFALLIALSSTYIYGEETKTSATLYKPSEALEIVKNANKYLNNNVEFTAKFDKFSILGLDYPNAMRSSEKYVGFTIQRDDIKDHNIPLSEMKLFLEQKKAEKYVDLDTGDVIKIQGKVFSTALNDPWVDVEKITVLKKAKETK